MTVLRQRQARARHVWAIWSVVFALSVVACGSDEPSGTSSAPDPLSLCADQQAPHVITFERASGDVQWVACGDEGGARYLEQVSDGIVYVNTSGAGAHVYEAFDAVDGHPVTDAPSPPPLMGLSGQTAVDGVTIRGGQDDPTTAKLADGRILWEQPGHWVYDDVVAIGDGAVYAIEMPTAVSPRLVAYEIDTGDVRWSAPGEPGSIPWELSPWAADDEHVVAGWANVHVFDTADGTPIWSTDWPTGGPGTLPPVHISGLVVDDDNVYVGIATESGPGD